MTEADERAELSAAIPRLMQGPIAPMPHPFPRTVIPFPGRVIPFPKPKS